MRNSTPVPSVLWVEQDEAVAHVIRRALPSLGYGVVACDSASSALEKLRAEPLRFKVLATVLDLPGSSGLDLAWHARAVQPKLRFIFADRALDFLQLQIAVALGPFEILRKPFGPAELQTALVRSFASEQMVG
jgi:CheY-like chemotaxis protein